MIEISKSWSSLNQKSSFGRQSINQTVHKLKHSKSFGSGTSTNRGCCGIVVPLIVLQFRSLFLRVHNLSRAIAPSHRSDISTSSERNALSPSERAASRTIFHELFKIFPKRAPPTSHIAAAPLVFPSNCDNTNATEGSLEEKVQS